MKPSREEEYTSIILDLGSVSRSGRLTTDTYMVGGWERRRAGLESVK
jgi:hypothetical protein